MTDTHVGYRFQAKLIILDYGKLDQIICGLEKMAWHEHLHHKSEGQLPPGQYTTDSLAECILSLG